MNWWLRSRRVPALAVALVLELAALLVLGGTVIPAPALLAGPAARVPAVVLAPLIVGSVVQYMLEASGAPIESAAVRRIGLIDAALVVGCVALAAAVGVVAAALGAPLAAETTRNTIGFVGLGLIAARFAGPGVGSAVPAVYVVLLAAFNVSRPRVAELWQWPLQDRSSLVAAATAVTLGITGVALIARGVRRG